MSNRAKEIESLMRKLGYAPVSAGKHRIVWGHPSGARCATPRSSDSTSAYRDIRSRARRELRSAGVEVNVHG